MSKKYELVQDIEDEGPRASIHRHMVVAATLIVVPVLAFAILSLVFGVSVVRQQATRDQNMRAAVMTQAALPPAPTRTPLPPPHVSSNTAMRAGPALRYDAIKTLQAGEQVTIIGLDSTDVWFWLDTGYWIPVVSVAGDVPPLHTLPHIPH